MLTGSTTVMNMIVFRITDGVLLLQKNSVKSLEIWLYLGLLLEKYIFKPLLKIAFFPTYIHLGS